MFYRSTPAKKLSAKENLEVTTQPQGHQQQVGRRALQQAEQELGRPALQQAEQELGRQALQQAEQELGRQALQQAEQQVRRRAPQQAEQQQVIVVVKIKKPHKDLAEKQIGATKTMVIVTPVKESGMEKIVCFHQNVVHHNQNVKAAVEEDGGPQIVK